MSFIIQIVQLFNNKFIEIKIRKQCAYFLSIFWIVHVTLCSNKASSEDSFIP
jgi:hypothetical protein